MLLFSVLGARPVAYSPNPLRVLHGSELLVEYRGLTSVPFSQELHDLIGAVLRPAIPGPPTALRIA
jgi:hypothetical protein